MRGRRGGILPPAGLSEGGARDMSAIEPLENHRYTLKEFMELELEDGARAELIGGEICMMSSPTAVHQRVVTILCAELGNYFSGKECKVYVAPLDVFIEDDCVQPDLMVLCDPAKILEDGKCHGGPDLVVEVLSKSTEYRDRTVKLNVYRNGGVKEYWIVDITRFDRIVAAVFRFEDGGGIQYTQYTNGDVAQSFLFEDMTVSIDEIVDAV
jgi:Uma2 family endonuclease